MNNCGTKFVTLIVELNGHPVLPETRFLFTLLKLLIMSRSSKAVVSFIVGAAVGVAVGYFLNSDKKEELVGKLRFQADKLKDKFRAKKQQFEDAMENELT